MLLILLIEDANVIVTGLKDATGEVTVTVNGKTYTAPIKNSEAKVTIPGLTESVTGNVNYNGDDKYNPASTTVNITVNPKPKENLTIEATAKPITVGEDAKSLLLVMLIIMVMISIILLPLLLKLLLILNQKKT